SARRLDPPAGCERLRRHEHERSLRVANARTERVRGLTSVGDPGQGDLRYGRDNERQRRGTSCEGAVLGHGGLVGSAVRVEKQVRRRGARLWLEGHFLA